MSQEERKKEEQYLEILYQSLHITSVYEDNFLKNLRGSKKALEVYRDEILDKINDKRRNLGLII